MLKSKTDHFILLSRLGVISLFALVIWFFCQIGHVDENAYHDGQAIYKTMCANCHLDNGEGLGGLIPPLANSDFLVTNRAQLPCLIRHGMEGEITVNGKKFSEKMPAFPQAGDVDIANLLNYINSSFGNDNPTFKLDGVQRLLKNCPLRKGGS